MFRKGTTLLRKKVKLTNDKKLSLIVPIFEDMIDDSFWTRHPEILSGKSDSADCYELGDNKEHVLIQYQIEKHKKRRPGAEVSL